MNAAGAEHAAPKRPIRVLRQPVRVQAGYDWCIKVTLFHCNRSNRMPRIQGSSNQAPRPAVPTQGGSAQEFRQRLDQQVNAPPLRHAGPAQGNLRQQFQQQNPINAVHVQPSSPSLPNSSSQQQTTQFLHDLNANSPTFRNTVSAATDGGRTPLNLAYDRIPERSGTYAPAGKYDSGSHKITLDPSHPLNADTNHMQNMAAFEFKNAASRQDFAVMNRTVDRGEYEQAARDRNAQHPSAPPVSGAQLYARDSERREWGNVKNTHQAMTEGAQAGMPIQSEYGNKLQAPPGGQAPWATFEGYAGEQARSGHTQAYVDSYNSRMAQHGRPVPDQPPSGWSSSSSSSSE